MNIVHSVTVSFVTFYANCICSERESLVEKIGVRRELVEHMVRGNFVVGFVTFYENYICSERESLVEKIWVRRELVEHMVRGNFVVGLEPNFGTKNSLSDGARMKFKNVNFFLPRKEYTRPKLY